MHISFNQSFIRDIAHEFWNEPFVKSQRAMMSLPNQWGYLLHLFLSPSKYLLRSESMRFSGELQANRFARAYEHRAKWVLFWTSLKVFTQGLKRDLRMPLKLFVWASQLKLLYSKTAARHLILPCSQIAAFPERGETVQSCECCCSKNVNITLSYWLYEVTAKWNAIKRWLHLGGVWLISWRS